MVRPLNNQLLHTPYEFRINVHNTKCSDRTQDFRINLVCTQIWQLKDNISSAIILTNENLSATVGELFNIN